MSRVELDRTSLSVDSDKTQRELRVKEYKDRARAKARDAIKTQTPPRQVLTMELASQSASQYSHRLHEAMLGSQ